MNRLLAGIWLMIGVVGMGCQQTQDADEPDTTVIKEKETVVKEPVEAEPAEGAADTDVKMEVKTDSGGASAEVKVDRDSK